MLNEAEISEKTDRLRLEQLLAEAQEERLRVERSLEEATPPADAAPVLDYVAEADPTAGDAAMAAALAAELAAESSDADSSSDGSYDLGLYEQEDENDIVPPGRVRPSSREDQTAAKAAAHEQLAHVQAVCVDGLRSQPEYNGMYRKVGEHDGWYRFASHEGMHLFRYVDDEEWYLDDVFAPNTPYNVAALFESPDGLLPVGEQIWKSWNDTRDDFDYVVITTTFLLTDAEVSEHTEQLRLVQGAAAVQANDDIANVADEDIDELVGWGFDQEAVVAALHATGGDKEAAANKLLG